MTRRALIGAAFASLTPLLACQSIIGAEFDDVTTVRCELAAPPPRPRATDTQGTNVEEIVAAITRVNLGDTMLANGSPGYRTIGFDLDGVCTGLGQRPSCRAFDWARPNHTDGTGGIDNSGGALLLAEDEAFGSAPFTSKVSNDGVAAGTIAPLAVVRIRGWNQRATDDAVELDWYLAEPFGKPYREASSGGAKPAWPISDGTLTGAPTEGVYPSSKWRAIDAYVNDSTLVARLPEGTPITLQNVRFATEGLLVALKIGFTAGQAPRVASGTLATRVRASELFAKMPQMTQAFKAPKICKNDVAYARVKRYFCRFVDSHADGQNDPDRECDAISIGMQLETELVDFGPLTPARTFEACPAEYDPVTEMCSIPVPPDAP